MKPIIPRILYVLIVYCGMGFTTSLYGQNQQSNLVQVANTLTDFEAIPLHIKIKSVMTNLVMNPDAGSLSDEDYVVASEAIATKYSMDETFDIFTYACLWLEDRILAENEIDASFIAEQLVLAEMAEQRNKANHFTQAYSALSSNGKLIVNEQIEEMRETNAISIMSTNFEALAVKDPQRIISSFSNFCKNLDGYIAQYYESNQIEVLQHVILDKDDE